MNDKIFESYGDILTTKELREVLKIGENKCYELLQSGQIQSIKIGRVHRIPKKNVILFLENSSSKLYNIEEAC